MTPSKKSLASKELNKNSYIKQLHRPAHNIVRIQIGSAFWEWTCSIHQTFKQHIRCGGQRNPEFIYKKLWIYSHMFKLQSPSKYSPFDGIHLSRFFFYCSSQFLNSSIFMSFSASAMFWFHLFHISKTFPFEDFFHQENKKKVAQCKMG